MEKLENPWQKRKKKCEIFYTLGFDPHPQECENSHDNKKFSSHFWTNFTLSFSILKASLNRRRVECMYPLTVMGETLSLLQLHFPTRLLSSIWFLCFIWKALLAICPLTNLSVQHKCNVDMDFLQLYWGRIFLKAIQANL